jgi:Tol biopolymer transport system component
VSGQNGSIAFVRFSSSREDDHSGQIFTRSPSGAVHQLTHLVGGASDPQWSPDGSQITFVRLGVQQHRPSQLYAMKSDGTDIKALSSGCTAAAKCLGDQWPTYSPDGSQIAFVRDMGPLVKVGARHEDFPSASDLMLVPAAGGAPQLVRHFQGDPIPGSPAWSPDATRLVVPLTTGKQPTKQTQFLDALNVLDIAGGTLTPITPLALGAENPDWSPDGQQIVFTSAAGHSPFVYLVHPDGSGLTKITRKTRIFSRVKSENNRLGNAPQFQATWSPDGKAIAFARETRPCGGHHLSSCTDSDRRAAWSIWTMRPDGHGARRLTSSPRFEAQPSWGPSR